MRMNHIFAPVAHDAVTRSCFYALPNPTTRISYRRVVIKIAFWAAKLTASKRAVKRLFAKPTPQFELLHLYGV